MVTYISSICALICCGMDKKVPNNYILLGVFTSCVSYLVGCSCALVSDKMIVLEAAALTGAMTLAITVYAITTKTDFTVCGPVLFIMGFIFAMAGILFSFTRSNNVIFAAIGVFLFSFYLLVDTQMIIGGSNRSYKIDEDSYILASVALYLDIINIFLYILRILNSK